MRDNRLWRLRRLLLATVAGGALVLSGAPAADASTFRYNPILFVHGIEGSGAQFESQAMRFESNRYPTSWVDEVDYNSTRAVGDKSEVDQQIDDAIAALKLRAGKSQVDVIAHSLGTSVMYDYLTNGDMAARRRANVGHYINVDGQNQNPGVPTLAVWAGRGTPGRNMDGAQNVTIPDQTHVQTMTSAESFVQYYEFLTGHRPKSDIVPQSGSIRLAGKALNFPENSGLSGATVQIWQVNDSGQRTSAAPAASLPITDGSTGGGAWGPDPVLSRLPFIQGADVYVAASSPPDETVSFQLISRGGGPVRTLNVPNWDSSTDGVTVQWNDFDKLTF